MGTRFVRAGMSAAAAGLFASAMPVMAAVPPMGAGAAAGDWTAWYGCWRAVVESDEAAPLVCVLPGDDRTTVRIATVEDGAITHETVVRADGVARPIEDGGCAGTERAYFSNDGRRVFTRAELSCTGLGRTSTGVLGMVSDTDWIDSQALTVNGQHAARTIRYRAVPASETPEWIVAELPQDQQLAQETARLDAANPLDIAAVIEASKAVAAPAVEALLAAREHGFGLNGARLQVLASQGVPASTIDVMVALSYPQRFAVTPRGPDRRDAEPALDSPNAARSWVSECYDVSWSRMSSRCQGGRYGYGYSRGGMYGYSPYGYDPYRWNYGRAPVIVVVRPEGDDEPAATGSVVKGRGYTRETGSSNGGATRRTTPAVARDKSEPSSARGTESTGSTKGSSGASSSGGGASQPATTTRTARPRGN